MGIGFDGDAFGITYSFLEAPSHCTRAQAARRGERGPVSPGEVG
jgi:hypothetical protein